jgi:hypothetical protein
MPDQRTPYVPCDLPGPTLDVLYPGEVATVTMEPNEQGEIVPTSFAVRPAPGFRAWWRRLIYRTVGGYGESSLTVDD